MKKAPMMASFVMPYCFPWKRSFGELVRNGVRRTTHDRVCKRNHED